MTRNRRDLTGEELALWRFVTRHVTRAPGQCVPIEPAHVAAPPSRHPVPEDRTASPASPPPRRTLPAPLALGASDGIDRRTAQRFARGEMPLDARLDLHGLTLREAQSATAGFVRAAAAAGRRCLLIITGKGGGSADGRGRIRGEALHWLDHPGLRSLILAVREARPHHGGGGALYVLLKRHRGT